LPLCLFGFFLFFFSPFASFCHEDQIFWEREHRRRWRHTPHHDYSNTVPVLYRRHQLVYSTMVPDASDNDVILNIYELIPDQQGQAAAANTSRSNSNVSSFFTRILTPMGFGAYHTSVDVHGYCYTFGAGGGIQKSKISNKAIHVPRNGVFKESITLGPCALARGEINEVVNRLRRKFFTETSYHLLNRNCNHFTETFATALVLAGRLSDQNPPCLKTFPAWVNRLAKTSTSLVNHDDVCDVLLEARHAAGMDDKVGWDLASSSASSSLQKQQPVKERSGKKKELTEAQKAALAKLRKNKK
jgi:hypothetical protein